MKTGIIPLIMLGSLIVLGSCSKKEEQKEILRPVRFEQVSLAGGQRVRTFSGVAKAGIETKLSFKVPGTIQSLKAKVGQTVKANQLVAAIDASDYFLQHEDAKASVKNADAQEKNAKSNYERVTLLYENQNASLSDFEAARTNYESAKAAEKSAKQRRELAKLQVSYCKLYAPVEGVIAERYVETNENVQSGQAIVLLNSGSDIEVEVSVPSLYITRVQVGQEADVKIIAIKDMEYDGVVTEVAFASSRAQTAFPVTLKIRNPDDRIRPGMAVDVSFTFVYEGSVEKLMVSPFSVGEDRDGRFVYVVAPSEDEENVGFIQKKLVTVGELTNDGMEIMEGINEGDLVVTAGVSRISDGMKVKLMQ